MTSWIAEGYLDRQHESSIKVALNKPHKHAHDYKLPPKPSSNLLTINEGQMGGSAISLNSINEGGQIFRLENIQGVPEKMRQ